jgi:hypothetical protein
MLSRIARVVVATSVAGCSMISGADDLVVTKQAEETHVVEGAATPPPPPPTDTTDSSEAKQGNATPNGSGSPKPPPPPPPADGIACGSTTCGGATPVCCLSIDGKGTCIDAEGECEPGVFRAECTQPSDCSGAGVCCLDMSELGSACRSATHCDVPSLVVCTNNDDCDHTSSCDPIGPFHVCN